MNKKMLAKVIRDNAAKVREQAQELADTDKYSDMCDSYEFLLCFARSLEGRALHKCFGAVGDWGYGSPTANALLASPEE